MEYLSGYIQEVFDAVYKPFQDWLLSLDYEIDEKYNDLIYYNKLPYYRELTLEYNAYTVARAKEVYLNIRNLELDFINKCYPINDSCSYVVIKETYSQEDNIKHVQIINDYVLNSLNEFEIDANISITLIVWSLLHDVYNVLPCMPWYSNTDFKLAPLSEIKNNIEKYCDSYTHTLAIIYNLRTCYVNIEQETIRCIQKRIYKYGIFKYLKCLLEYLNVSYDDNINDVLDFIAYFDFGKEYQPFSITCHYKRYIGSRDRIPIIHKKGNTLLETFNYVKQYTEYEMRVFESYDDEMDIWQIINAYNDYERHKLNILALLTIQTIISHYGKEDELQK